VRRRFRERYNEAADRLERALMLWLGIALAVLIIAQVMLAGRGLVGWLAPLDQLDRQVTTNLAGDGRGELPETYVTISLIDHRTAWRAWVLVNGKEIATFRSRQLVVGVKAGDLVEIDGTAYSGAVTFRVVAVSNNLSQPRIGDEVTTRGSIEQLKRITK
jgi:hypothetical protein